MSPRPVTLADIEAALRYRFRPLSPGDVDTLLGLVTAYAEARGLAVARQRVLGERQGALMDEASSGDAALRAARAEVRRRGKEGIPISACLLEMARQYERDKKRAQRERLATRGEAA